MRASPAPTRGTLSALSGPPDTRLHRADSASVEHWFGLSVARSGRPHPDTGAGDHMGAADEQKKPSRKLEITSLVLSVVAIITAGLTYLDQRSVNGITQARYERRYADRIAWWPDNSGANEEIRVQNRSTMPISNVVVGHVSSALVDPGSTESWLLKVSG